MENIKQSKKRIVIFLALTVVISWAVFLLIPLSGMTYGNGMSVVILMLAMFMPALCSILTRLITKEGFKNMYLNPHFNGHIRHYLLIYFGPTLLLFLSGAVYFLLFPAAFDPEFTVFKQATAVAGTLSVSVVSLLLISAVQVIVIGPVINIIPTLGEELGWRGYLLPKLRTFLSDRGALALTGVIWGLWHAPIIWMGHNYGTDYPGYPWLGILAMVLFCLMLGIIEGYAAIKLQSVIPAAMIHSLVNAGAAFPIYLAKTGYNTLLGPAITGAAGAIPFIILAIILLIKSSGKKPAAIGSAPEPDGPQART
jgi:membrane protease YdiL (CAAX protease family)